MILITGGLGFIGTHCTAALLDLGQSCVAVQRSATDVPEELRPVLGTRLFAHSVDVQDRAGLLDIGRRHQITGIVHLADPGVVRLWRQPSAETSLDLGGLFDGLFNVLQAAREWEVSRVCIASTVGVYGGVGDGPLREDMPLPLATGHAIPVVKLCSESLASFVGSQLGIEVVIFRPSAIWGPGGRDDSPFFAAPRLIHSAVRGVVADFTSGPRTAYAGDAVDTCYVRDCGRAIALLQTTPSLHHRTYNIGAGRAISNGEVAAAVQKLIPNAAHHLLPGRSPGSPEGRAYLDISRLAADTSYSPAFDLDHAVADYVAWLQPGRAR